MKKSFTISLFASLGIITQAYAAQTNYYSNLVPGTGDTNLYYSMGGGNVVPNAPSVLNRQTVKMGGSMGVNYNCGEFDPKASIVNSFNGIENSFTNIFNSTVSNAKGAVLAMPAYLISRNNPSLYQILQNGFQSGQLDFGMATKSCQQMMSEIDNGKNPYDNFAKLSTSNNWREKMGSSGMFSSGGGPMTYQGAQETDIGQALHDVNETNGKKGVPWVKGVQSGGNESAGGEGQPPIKLTYDVVMAGANVMIGQTKFDSDAEIPKDEAMSHYWQKPSDAANWAEAVLGEKEITTYNSGQKSSTPGKGLLPEVQTTFEEIYPTLYGMVVGSEEINVENLQKVSTSSVILNKSVIQTLAREKGITQNIQISALTQGIASAKVVDEAQMLIQMLQSAQQVPAISTNESAQNQIQQNINTLNSQIQKIVQFKKTNESLITSTINTIVAARERDNSRAASVRPSGSAPTVPTNGVISTKTDDE